MPNRRRQRRTPTDLFPPGAGPEPGSAHFRYVEDRIAESGRWGTETLAACVDRHARERGDRTAYVGGAQRMTWDEYARRSRTLAGALATTFERGTRVGVLMDDGPDVHVAYVAAERAGVTAVGIGPRAGAREVEHLLRVTGARGLLSAPRHRDLDLPTILERAGGTHGGVAHVVVGNDGSATIDGAEPHRCEDLDGALAGRALDVGEVFLVNSTSGTTGMPKCVVHTQDRWRYFHRLACEAADLRETDVVLGLVPAPFGFGVWTAHTTPTLLGCPTVVLARFSPEEALATIERERVTVLACVSTQFIMLLNSDALDDHDLSSLRIVFTGGEAVPFERAAELEARTGARVLQFYGSNETGALSRTTLADDRDHRLRTAGRVVEEMHVRLFDEAGADVTSTGQGRAACAGPATSLGYDADPEANATLIEPSGAMLTGDVVTIDDDRYLRVVGRTSDFIIRGGKNVSAAAVEEEVATHPAVALVAAVAAPDEVFGERVCTYVTLRTSAGLTLDELRAHLAERGVSKEMFPEHLVVADELPRSSGGKVAKATLRADIRRRLGATLDESP